MTNNLKEENISNEFSNINLKEKHKLSENSELNLELKEVSNNELNENKENIFPFKDLDSNVKDIPNSYIKNKYSNTNNNTPTKEKNFDEENKIKNISGKSENTGVNKNSNHYFQNSNALNGLNEITPVDSITHQNAFLHRTQNLFNETEPNVNYQAACNNLPNSSKNLTNLNNAINSNLTNLTGISPGLDGLAGFGNLTGISNLNSFNNNNFNNHNNNNNISNIPSSISNIVANYQMNVNGQTSTQNVIYDNPIVQEYSQNPLEALESASHDSDNLVLNYTSNKPLYGIAFQKADFIRLAISTMDHSSANKIEILDLINDKLRMVICEPQEFPITKLMWSPGVTNTNFLASSSDIIRLFKYEEESNKLNMVCALNNKKSRYSSPLTSFDWNSKNPSILGTASIDTTCTIWDLNKMNIRTQLIAHDKEVFDIAFSQNEHVFISTGADGSIRLFDLRSLEHSTIMYETKDPISKIAFNSENSNLISAIVWKKDTVNIIDSRVAMMSLVDLKSHSASVTGMSWAPQSGTHICSVGEDKFVLIWNIESQIENPNSGPILSYKAPEAITNVNWCFDHPEWIAITFNNQLQLLRV